MLEYKPFFFFLLFLLANIPSARAEDDKSTYQLPESWA